MYAAEPSQKSDMNLSVFVMWLFYQNFISVLSYVTFVIMSNSEVAIDCATRFGFSKHESRMVSTDRHTTYLQGTIGMYREVIASAIIH